MGFGFRKSFRFGWKYLHVRVNASKTGTSWSVKVLAWSWNSRAKQHRVDLPGPFHWIGRKHTRRR